MRDGSEQSEEPRGPGWKQARGSSGSGLWEAVGTYGGVIGHSGLSLGGKYPSGFKSVEIFHTFGLC